MFHPEGKTSSAGKSGWDIWISLLVNSGTLAMLVRRWAHVWGLMGEVVAEFEQFGILGRG